jgi:hypothetical protein
MSSKPASAAEIRRLLGPVEESLIAAVLATGATAGDVIEARAWTEADEVTDQQHAPTGIVGEVYDILVAEGFTAGSLADDEL